MQTNTNKYKLNLRVDWEETKEKLKEVHTELTDDDLEFAPGKVEEMLDRVGKRIGKNREETRAWIESVAYNDGIAS